MPTRIFLSYIRNISFIFIIIFIYFGTHQVTSPQLARPRIKLNHKSISPLSYFSVVIKLFQEIQSFHVNKECRYYLFHFCLLFWWFSFSLDLLDLLYFLGEPILWGLLALWFSDGQMKNVGFAEVQDDA